MYSFFSGLNAFSKDPGDRSLFQEYNSNSPYYEKDYVDLMVLETIKYNWDRGKVSFPSAILATFDTLYGNHYLIEGHPKNPGRKGVLDIFVLPLLARLIAFKSELPMVLDQPSLTNVLATLIVIPIELIRFTAAATLTILLIPITACVHLLRSIIDPSKPSSPELTPNAMGSIWTKY